MYTLNDISRPNYRLLFVSGLFCNVEVGGSYIYQKLVKVMSYDLQGFKLPSFSKKRILKHKARVLLVRASREH